jgi:hypothetical protein
VGGRRSVSWPQAGQKFGRGALSPCPQFRQGVGGGSLQTSGGHGAHLIASVLAVADGALRSLLKPRDLPEFKWVNRVLGNLQATLASTVRSPKYRNHAGHCLAAFAWRFDRRVDLRGLVARLVVDAARCASARESVARAHAGEGDSSGAEMPFFSMRHG